ncbi:unnamed protein product, partial [Ectocarpus sp. 12 AP-2014]
CERSERRRRSYTYADTNTPQLLLSFLGWRFLLVTLSHISCALPYVSRFAISLSVPRLIGYKKRRRFYWHPTLVHPPPASVYPGKRRVHERKPLYNTFRMRLH